VPTRQITRRHATYVATLCTVAGQWQLWGTFSVADHLRSRAFASDVLVYDRLIVPVPPDEDRDRWRTNRWQPERQQEILEVLRDGDSQRVLEIPWDAQRQGEFEQRRGDVAAGAAHDVFQVKQFTAANPDAPLQYVTRMVLTDRHNPELDDALARRIVPGLPRVQIDVVAAYGTAAEMASETDVVETSELPASPDELLGGFVWPFAVPADSDCTDVDLLKRAVEFANQPEVQSYREAFHRWRGEIIQNGETPEGARQKLENEIETYQEWVRREGAATTAQGACVVVGVATGVAAALLPVVGLPVAAAVLGIGAAGSGALGPITSRLFRGRLKAVNAACSPGALFWEARRAMGNASGGRQMPA